MHYRCSHCNKRRHLSKPPESYVRLPRCAKCGRRRYKRDLYRATFERGDGARKAGLVCVGCRGYYAFPHRRGSRFCEHNPRLTDDDIRELHERGSYR